MDRVTDPVAFFTAIGWGMLLLCSAIGISLAYQMREEIGALMRRVVHRYVRIERRGPTVRRTTVNRFAERARVADLDVLSSGDMETEKSTGTVPVPVPVPAHGTSDDDIIIYLATIKKDGETVYRFSKNAIYDLVKGSRPYVLKKIDEARDEADAETPADPSPPDPPRTIVVRDSGAPAREIPI